MFFRPPARNAGLPILLYFCDQLVKAAFFLRLFQIRKNETSKAANVAIQESGQDATSHCSVWKGSIAKTVQIHTSRSTQTPMTQISMGVSEDPIPRSVPDMTSISPHRK